MEKEKKLKENIDCDRPQGAGEGSKTVKKGPESGVRYLVTSNLNGSGFSYNVSSLEG